MILAVSSADPSSITSNSKSEKLCCSTELIASLIYFDALYAGINMVTMGVLIKLPPFFALMNLQYQGIAAALPGLQWITVQTSTQPKKPSGEGPAGAAHNSGASIFL